MFKKKVHIVQKGENTLIIAKKHGVSIWDIYRANKKIAWRLADGVIFVGDELKIPIKRGL